MLEFIFSFPVNFFLGLSAFIILCLGVQRIMNESSSPTFTFHDTIKFFAKSSDLIAIIGVIATIISLAPLFLTFISGEDWFHILLATQIGIQVLGLIIFATIFAAFFIYCILALFIFRWSNQILRNCEVRLSEKIISLVILFCGIITVICLVWFLVEAWFTRLNPAVSITGLVLMPFVLSLGSVIGIAVLIDFTSLHPYSIRSIFSIVIMLLFFAIIGYVFYPTINDSATIYKIGLNYTTPEKYNFSFQDINVTNPQNGPIIIFIQPNLTAYPKENNPNVDYIDCHWSTNYGYFFTVNSENLFTQRKSNEFTIPKCILNQNYSVFWTYDISDYSKSKPSGIISLQVENSNKRSANEKLGESIEYIVGNTHENFTWTEQDTIAITKNST